MSYKINQNLCLAYLFIALVFAPLIKYFEYVLNFPRINITAIYTIIFLVTLSLNLYYYNKPFKDGIFSSFWLLVMVSIIQIISFPWVVDYNNDGLHTYLTLISRTILQYWLFWFVGIHIYQIWNRDTFWRIMFFLWLFLASLIIYSALSNKVFAIILNGQPIYLMLADSFAILSLFMLCKTKNSTGQILIILITTICLFALFSRASLYCFVLTAILFLYKQNKGFMLLILTTLFLLLFLGTNDEIAGNRMLRMFYGVEDLSATMRQDHMEKGLDALSSTWFLGDFMGDIKQHFGKTGYYMHNYLSFWRQFGIVPFIAFSVILIFGSIRILKVWLKSEKLNQVHLFLFHFTVFALSEIIVARSFVTPYIWLSVGGLSLFSNNKNQVE